MGEQVESMRSVMFTQMRYVEGERDLHPSLDIYGAQKHEGLYSTKGTAYKLLSYRVLRMERVSSKKIL